MRIRIGIANEIAAVCPDLCVLAVQAKVTNTPFDARLWEEIEVLEKKIRATSTIGQVNKIPTIYATRQAYKKMGKDPNRYRPSAEALYRRIHRGLPLYRINTLVDLINLISLDTGYSIGGFDADKIDGNLLLGIGREGEPYRGIGRGELNIEGLPVYRDNTGGIGTPTSDEERTKISLETTNLLMLINAYSGNSGLEEVEKHVIDWLQRYLSAKEITTITVN